MKVGDVTVLFLFYIRTKNTSYNRILKGGNDMMNILTRLFCVLGVVILAPFAIAGDLIISIWTIYKGIFDIIRGR